MEPEGEFELETPVNTPAPEVGFKPYDGWAWPQLIEALDKAGYRIVKKPELLERGLRSGPEPHGK